MNLSTRHRLSILTQKRGLNPPYIDRAYLQRLISAGDVKGVMTIVNAMWEKRNRELAAEMGNGIQSDREWMQRTCAEYGATPDDVPDDFDEDAFRIVTGISSTSKFFNP